MAYFEPDFLQFFIELAANNHKDWFDENRKRYAQSVKDPFKNYIEDLIIHIKKEDQSIQIAAKDSIFRINRDIRFSKDKTPYKMDRTASISAKGKKDHSSPGFYVSLGPEKLMFGGGAYFLPPPILKKVRESILAEPEKFNDLANDSLFLKTFGSLKGEENKRLPSKEMTAAAETEPLLYRKQFYYMTDLDSDLILKDSLMEESMKHYSAGKKMQDFLKAAMS